MSTSYCSVIAYGVKAIKTRKPVEVQKFNEDTGDPYIKTEYKYVTTIIDGDIELSQDVVQELYDNDQFHTVSEKAAVLGVRVSSDDCYSSVSPVEVKLTDGSKKEWQGVKELVRCSAEPKLYHFLEVG